MSEDFYTSLPAHKSFFEVVESGRFQPAPDDWLIVVADIKSSTAAVSAGRYKDVNLTSGCVISAVLNAVKNKHRIPFVFGGDGATMLIPPDDEQPVRDALIGTRSLAENQFGLSLRIGLVSAREARIRGEDVLVARYEVSAGNSLAVFIGGGFDLAEQLVKNDDAQNFAIADHAAAGPPDLTGLSCRWEPLVAQHDAILCLLIKPTASAEDMRRSQLQEVMRITNELLDDTLDEASPVKLNALKFRWPPRGLLAEIRATKANRFFLTRALEVVASSLIQLFLERFSKAAGGYDGAVYKHSLCSNNDYCRYDDTLRLVLDCTTEQIERLHTKLTTLQREGSIEFGTFQVDQALMTCMVLSMQDGEHLHFIDGDRGGFWEAATSLKETADS